MTNRLAVPSFTGAAIAFASMVVVTGEVGAAQDVLYQSIGSLEAGHVGQHVAGFGDINGDGVGDFAYSTNEPNVHVIAVSGATGQPLWKTKITLGFWGFQVQAMAACGDIDGDGVTDIIAGSPGSINGGAVAALSGRTGKVLWWRWSGIANDRYGTAVAGIGDVNGNGIPDVLVGAIWAEPSAPSQSAQGAVWVLDGANGAPIYVVYGPPVPGQAGGSEYGRVVGAVCDQDGDGIEDFVVASGWTPYIIDLRSGGDGSLIRHLEMPTGALVPQSSAGARDMDADGTEEFVIGFSGACDGHSSLSGMVAVYQRGGQAIFSVLCGEAVGEDSGRAICADGDLNGDGVPDVLVGSRLAAPGGGMSIPPWGYLRAYCGGDLSPLFVYSPPATMPPDPYFGLAIATIGDITQDGRAEFVVGTSLFSTPRWGQGKVAVYSPTKLSLRGTPHLVPLQIGQAQRLTVDFGEAHAGQPFLLLGTMAGTKPSLWVDGLPLALVPDDYTVLALSGVGIAQPWVGVLDGSGKAQPLAPIPPLSAPLKAALVGKSVWHVALTLGPAGTVSSISNPVSMTFLP